MIFLKLFFYYILNYFLFLVSAEINFDQFTNDLKFLGFENVSNNIAVNIVALSVSALSLIILRVFKPFMDLYILHYFKFSFYVVINLLSISSIYIVFRIYGYSRLYLVAYLLIISTSQIIFEKLSR
jgi:hypothetical protein